MANQPSRGTDFWAIGGGIYYGYNAKGAMKLYTGDRHVVSVSPNGTGKTRRSLLVTAARLAGKWSMVLPDIKGELSDMLRQHFIDQGSKVIELDPFGETSEGYNTTRSTPIDDDLIDNLMRRAEALIRSDSNNHQPHYPQGAQDLWTGVEGYVRLAIDNGSLGDVRAILSKGTGELSRIIGDDEFTYEGKVYPGMLKAFTLLGYPKLSAKVSRFSDINPSNNELLGIISTALVASRTLDSPRLDRDLRGSVIDFSVLKEEPTVVFIKIPPKRLSTHANWVRIVLTDIVNALMTDVKRAKVPCLLALDEYYALADGGFDVITKNMAMFRGYGIKLWTIWQDLSQAQKLLGRDGFETFLANAGLLQAFAPQCLTTSEYLSRRTGQTTRQALSLNGGTSRTPGSRPNRSDTASLSQIATPLLLPQDIRALPDGDALVLSHALDGGQGIYHFPYPTEIDFMKEIMKRDPAA